MGQASNVPVCSMQSLRRCQERETEMSQANFYHGVMAALAVVADHDEPTIAKDIANTLDAQLLWDYADAYEEDILRRLNIKRPKGKRK